jgi:eukaryotic-like serine/threonine-protein kinase
MQIEVLGERYQLQDPIGRGGMATIYRGRDMRMDRIVAIKVLREVYSTDPKFVTRFQREAKAASSLQHPNIVQVYDYGQSDGNYFIVMELVEGTDLRRYLRSRGVLAIDRAIIIAHDVALGLSAAHRRGIVHRDVKPQNILVGRDGSIKLTDFGIASVYKDINAERLTTTGMTLGTVQYYAPEQAQGEIVSPAADVYALGIVMYEMLTGRTPFDGDTPVAVAMQHIQDPPTPPSHFNPAIPPALEEIIMRCLEKVPEMRFRDGSALARALEVLGDEEMAETTLNTPPGNGKLPPSSGNFAYNQAAQRGSSNGTLAPSQNGAVESAATIPQPFAPVSSDRQRALAGADVNSTYPASTDGGTLRPSNKGAAQEQRDSRFASIVTMLILLATLLLLGFSIYLADQLGFLHLPFNIPGNATPNVSQGVAVPSLLQLSYAKAKQLAQANHFTIKNNSKLADGIVINQYPLPGAKAPSGSVILVDLAPPGTTPTVTVPDGLVGQDLATVEQLLNNAHIPFEVRDGGTDPTKNQNTVVRTDPPGGSVLPGGQVVVLYVANYNSGAPGVTPQTTPVTTPATTPSAGTTPTAKPKPTPTATPKPTATPTTPPTATPTTPPASPTATSAT